MKNIKAEQTVIADAKKRLAESLTQKEELVDFLNDILVERITKNGKINQVDIEPYYISYRLESVNILEKSDSMYERIMEVMPGASVTIDTKNERIALDKVGGGGSRLDITYYLKSKLFGEKSFSKYVIGNDY